MKRVIAFICAFTLLVGFVPATAMVADAEVEGQYQVGYAKLNINPIIENNVTGEGFGVPAKYLLNGTKTDYNEQDLADHRVMASVHLSKDASKDDVANTVQIPIIAVPLRGYGGDNRNAKYLTDDNGDGYIIPTEDGLFVTATFVTDATGNSIVYVTMDASGADSFILKEVRRRVYNDLKSSLPRLEPEHIILSSSHSHASFNAVTLNEAWTNWADYSGSDASVPKYYLNPPANCTPNTLYAAYYQYVIDRTVQVVEEAFADRTAATMTKGQVDASETMPELDSSYKYTSGDLAGQGYYMNFNRHYDVTYIKEHEVYYKNTHEPNNQYWSKATYNFTVGDNFNKIDALHSGLAIGERVLTNSTEANPGQENYVKDYEYLEATHVTESDDTLQVLKFDREDPNRDILLIDWRAHAAINGNGKLYNISSDYINALRAYLENAGYCVAYWQGSSGNVNPTSQDTREYAFKSGIGWSSIVLSEVKTPQYSDTKANVNSFYYSYYNDVVGDGTNGTIGETNFSERFYRAALYGTLLGKLTEYCLRDHMSGTLDMSEIKVQTFTYYYNAQQYSDDWTTVITKYKNNTDVISPAGAAEMAIVTVNSKHYVINSGFHAQKLESRLLVDENWNSGMRSFNMTVVVMGKNVAVLTASGEMFDYYDAAKSTAPEDNDWVELENYLTNDLGLSYGKPFAISYTNGDNAYIPNTRAYSYKTYSAYAYPNNVQPSGSYEVNVAEFSAGFGEKVIELYKTMLIRMGTAQQNDKLNLVKECTSCGKEVVWQPLYQEMINSDLSTGHYYLAEDLNGQNTLAVKNIGAAGEGKNGSSSSYSKYQQNNPETVCLDLNGHSFVNYARCFAVKRYGRLNIFDSVGGGVVQGTVTGSNPAGGTYTTEGECNIYLYGGTHRTQSFNVSNNMLGWGGVVSLRGNLHIYGARIEGTTIGHSNNSTADFNGSGGAIYAYAAARINIYNGAVITSGTIPTESETVYIPQSKTDSNPNGDPLEHQVGPGYGPCIFAEGTSKITLSGNAYVEDIFLAESNLYNSYRAINGNEITINSSFTGTVGLSGACLDDKAQDGVQVGLPMGAGVELDIGDLINTNALAANIHSNDPEIGVYTIGTDLYLNKVGDAVAAVITDNSTKLYTNFTDAIAAVDGRGYIKLLKTVAAPAEEVTKNIRIDLAGNNITGTLNIANRKKFYVMDSATDNFEGAYGTITADTNKVVALTPDSGLTENTYLKVEESGMLSFHRVQLDVVSMTTRTKHYDEKLEKENIGLDLQYDCVFTGDEMVKNAVKQFGVAVSTSGVPDAANITSCLKTEFDTFEAGLGANGSTGSTWIYNIIKNDGSATAAYNDRRAAIDIYGRPYIQLENGEYIFGHAVKRNLRQQLEATDEMWNKLDHPQRTGMLNAYDSYANKGLSAWDTIPNMQSAAADNERDVIRILEVGNSHGLDSTNLLVEVIKAENPNAKVIVGALYKSGCRLDEHYNYMSGNSASYDYYKNATFTQGVTGITGTDAWQITKGTTALTALQDEDWDIITLQQMSHWSAVDTRYIEPQINYILDYMKNNKKNPENEPIMMWNMVWANPDGELFTNYVNGGTTEVERANRQSWGTNNYNTEDGNGNPVYSKDIQFANIYRCVQKYIVSSGQFQGVLPVATGIQYAINVGEYGVNQLYRDYTHVSDLGRLIAAYIWYGKIFGVTEIDSVNVDTVDNDLRASYNATNNPNPGDLTFSDADLAIAKNAINYALANPYTAS